MNGDGGMGLRQEEGWKRVVVKEERMNEKNERNQESRSTACEEGKEKGRVDKQEG